MTWRRRAFKPCGAHALVCMMLPEQIVGWIERRQMLNARFVRLGARICSAVGLLRCCVPHRSVARQDSGVLWPLVRADICIILSCSLEIFLAVF